jgi:hypothetical protein
MEAHGSHVAGWWGYFVSARPMQQMNRPMELTPTSPKPARGYRLVFPDDCSSLAEAQARRAVVEENRQASRMAAADDATALADVRRVFALRASQCLQGGRAAILPPENRRVLIGEARRYGLRAFEANLIIAIVQDGARRGELPGSSSTSRVLDLIPARARREGVQLLVQRLIIAALLGAGMLTLMIRWVSGL